MKYTVWFYDAEGNRKYDCFTGTKYQCRKFKKYKSFSWQYRIFKAIW